MCELRHTSVVVQKNATWPKNPVGTKRPQPLTAGGAMLTREDYRQLEHVPPRLNQGDSRGAKDGRVYRHWFAFGRLGDAEGLFWGDAGTSDCGGRKWSFTARGGRGVCG